MPLVQIDAGDLYYEVVGAGPPLLLIAGFAANATDRQTLQPVLEAHSTVIMLDNRGAGRPVSRRGRTPLPRWRMMPPRFLITWVCLKLRSPRRNSRSCCRRTPGQSGMGCEEWPGRSG